MTEGQEGNAETRFWVKVQKVADLAAKSVSQPRERAMKDPNPDGPKETTPEKGGERGWMGNGKLS